MSSSLPRSTPADQRVDPAAILSFLDAVDERPGVEMHSLMVVRHGRVVAEGWWAPYSAGRPQLLYSLSKSFTSTAVERVPDHEHGPPLGKPANPRADRTDPRTPTGFVNLIHFRVLMRHEAARDE